MIKPSQITQRVKKIKLIVLDVDGVLTDAGLMMGHNGFEYIKFNVQDGAGIVLAKKLGFKFALITGRNTPIIDERAKMLGIDDVYQNKFHKLESYSELLKKHSLKDENICYMGDDILDLPILMRVGFSVAPANALSDVKKQVHYVCKQKGGEGAVREMIEVILEGAGLKKKLIEDILEGRMFGKSV